MIYEYIKEGLKSSSFFLLPFPTGSGKTYAVKKFINSTSKKVLFVTHLHHLLEDVYKDVKNKKVLYLKSDVQSVLDVIDEKFEFVNRYEEFKNIKKYSKIRGDLYDILKDDVSKLKFRILSDSKRLLSKDLTKLLNDAKKLFPSVEIEKYDVVITTTQKLARGFFNFENKTFKSVFKDGVLFIDEFDAQKEVLTDVFCDLKDIEIIDLFLRIYFGINQKEFIKRYNPSKELRLKFKTLYKKGIDRFYRVDTVDNFYTFAMDSFNGVMESGDFIDKELFDEIKSTLNWFFSFSKRYINEIDEYLRYVLAKNRDEFYSYALKKILYQDFELGSLKDDFYSKGFSLINISREVDSEIESFKCYDVFITPEGFLKSLNESMQIVGISATSEIETVIGNFDLDYLEVDKFEVPLKELEDREIISKVFDGDLHKCIRECFLGDLSALEIMNFIKRVNEYALRKFIHFFYAYKEFMDNNIHTFLYLEMPYLTNYKSFSKEFNELFTLFCAVNGFENYVTELRDKREFKAGKRSFIISSYKNIGVGVNLQYEYKGFVKDIDAIYLGEVTNLIPEDKLKSVFILYSLYVNGYIGSFKKYFLEIVNGNFRGVKGFYAQTDDFVANVVRVLIQAVGRLYRAKNDKIYVYTNKANSDIIASYVGDVYLPKALKSLVGVERGSVKPSFETRIKIKNSHIKSKFSYYKKGFENSKIVLQYKKLREEIYNSFSLDEEKEFNEKFERKYFYKQKDDFNYLEISFEKKRGFSEYREFEFEGEFKKFECKIKGEYLLLPYAYEIFKGVLGEKVGAYVFNNHFSIKLEEVEEFEVFDFKFKDNYIDFKNYSDFNLKRDIMPLIEKVALKLKRVGGKKAFLINVFGKEGKIYEVGDVVVVPYLIKGDKVNMKVREWFD